MAGDPTKFRVVDGESGVERLTESWVIEYVKDERSNDGAEVTMHGELTTDEEGCLWMTRKDKPIAVFNSGVWRQARRIRLVETEPGEFDEIA